MNRSNYWLQCETIKKRYWKTPLGNFLFQSYNERDPCFLEEKFRKRQPNLISNMEVEFPQIFSQFFLVGSDDRGRKSLDNKN